MRISVITVCKNSALHIERAIKSVLEQSYSDRQYIIIDGNSEDSTMKIINNYRSAIDVILSEKDTGIYNAMNKALRFVKGDIVYFLNSDDSLCDKNVFEDVVREFRRTSENTILFGNVIMNVDGKSRIVRFN